MKNEHENEMNREPEADRAWLRQQFEKAGKPELPASLSAAALFARMDAEEEKAEASPAAEEKRVIRIEWRRWGSIAAALVLAVGVAFLLKGGALTDKSSVAEPDLMLPQFSMTCRDAANGQESITDNNESAKLNSAPNDVLTASPEEPDINPDTAGGDDYCHGYPLQSVIVVSGEQPTPDLDDYEAVEAVASRLYGSDYAQVYAMLYDSGDRWEACELPQSCAHYFLLDKTLYGFFPEERRLVDYREECATVLNEDEAAMLSAILQMEFTAKNE